MQQFIRNYLKIHAGEGQKVAYFVVLAMLLQSGLALGISTADSLFLTKVGADKLPFIYLLTPLMMLVYIPIMAYFLNRYGIDRIFNSVLYLLIAGGIALCLILTFFSSTNIGQAQFIYYIAKLYSTLWFIALYTLIWNFIDQYFDILDAKRLFPLFSAGLSCGTLLGGMLVTGLVSLISVEQLFLIWSVISFLTFPILIRIRSKFNKIVESETSEDEEETFFQQFSSIITTIGKSRFTSLLILSSLSILIVTTICEYQYMMVFEQGRSAKEVASLFGILYAFVNCFNLIFNLFVFNRLIAILGVRNMTLIQPIVYILSFSYFLLAHGFGAAIFGFIAYQGILMSIEYNNQNFLFNALPSKGKVAVRTFIEGLCEPMSTALAGFFLLFIASKISPEALSSYALVGAGIALCLAFGLRSQYLNAMVRNLKEKWLDLTQSNDMEIVTVLTDKDIQFLRKTAQSQDKQAAINAIQILCWHDLLSGFNLLLEYIENSSIHHQQYAVPLLSEMLSIQHVDIAKYVLIWIENVRSRISPQILEVCGKYNLLSNKSIDIMLNASSIEQKTAAAVALWNSWKIDGNLQCIHLTNQLLNGNENEKLAAIRIIGQTDLPRYAHYIAQYLKSPFPKIQKEALSAIKNISDQSTSHLMNDILSAMQNGDSEIRLIGFDILETINRVECIRPLLIMSKLFTPIERRKTEELLINIGLRSVPTLVEILQDPYFTYDCKSIVSRALVKCSFPQFEAISPTLIDKEIVHAYDVLCYHWLLSKESDKNSALNFLSRFYKDIHTYLIDFILELLALSGKLPNFELIAASLRSDNVKARGNAIETIEQGCSRKVFIQLLPLVDSRPIEDKIQFYMNHFNKTFPTIDQILVNGLNSLFQIECVGSIHAIWEIWHTGKQEKDYETTLIQKQNDILKSIENKMLDPSMDIVKSVTFPHMAKDYYKDTPSHEMANILEQIIILYDLEFFNTLRLPEIEMIIRDIKQITYQKDEMIYQKGSAAEKVFVITKGNAQLVSEEQTEHIDDKRLFGIEVINGQDTYETDAISLGGQFLAISKNSIIDTADAYPSSAINLFAFRQKC